MAKRNVFLVTVFMALALGLVGCKKKDDQPAPTSAAPATTAAPAAPAAPSTGTPDCDAYMASMAKLDACTKLPDEAKTTFKRVFAEQQKAFSAGGSDPSGTAEGCRTQNAALVDALGQIGCD